VYVCALAASGSTTAIVAIIINVANIFFIDFGLLCMFKVTRSNSYFKFWNCFAINFLRVLLSYGRATIACYCNRRANRAGRGKSLIINSIIVIKDEFAIIGGED
jgi:hypothetical protein